MVSRDLSGHEPAQDPLRGRLKPCRPDQGLGRLAQYIGTGGQHGAHNLVRRGCSVCICMYIYMVYFAGPPPVGSLVPYRIRFMPHVAVTKLIIAAMPCPCMSPISPMPPCPTCPTCWGRWYLRFVPSCTVAVLCCHSPARGLVVMLHGGGVEGKGAGLCC